MKMFNTKKLVSEKRGILFVINGYFKKQIKNPVEHKIDNQVPVEFK